MMIGFLLSSGNDATMLKPSLTVRRCVAMPIRTWPSTTLGAPLAWNDTKSIGVPTWPVARTGKGLSANHRIQFRGRPEGRVAACWIRSITTRLAGACSKPCSCRLARASPRRDLSSRMR